VVRIAMLVVAVLREWAVKGVRLDAEFILQMTARVAGMPKYAPEERVCRK